MESPEARGSTERVVTRSIEDGLCPTEELHGKWRDTKEGREGRRDPLDSVRVQRGKGPTQRTELDPSDFSSLERLERER